MTNRPTQAAAETLERKAIDAARRLCFDAQSPTGTSARTFSSADLAYEFVEFASVLLEEARPYMAHKSNCQSAPDADFGSEDAACSCGLAELMEGWKNGM